MKYLCLKLPARILFVIMKMSVLIAVVDIEDSMFTKVCWMSLTSEQYDLHLICFFLAASSVDLICFKSNWWLQSKFIKDFDNEILEQANCISTRIKASTSLTRFVNWTEFIRFSLSSLLCY